MLSRVADSLYWMSRYFERADHCARIIEANYNLLLNPSKLSTEQRWHRVTASIGLRDDPEVEPQDAMIRLTADPKTTSSIVSCIREARENASQVREQISSEMWERLNRIYHEVLEASSRLNHDFEPLRVVSSVRTGSYAFSGVTDATMNHGEGWYFIQMGKYIERAGALSVLLDAHFSHSDDADDLEWAGLLSSCGAFEAYCRVYTADLKPDRVAEFLMLNPEFPYSVRYSVDKMQHALNAISEVSPSRHTSELARIVGRLRASLAYVLVQDIMAGGFRKYLNGVIEQCMSFHAAMHQVYIDYPIESALEA
jgi:uncharacterized alpha-E superfamily protein